MKNGHGEPWVFQRWETLYKDALFESDFRKMPGRIDLAKHAILDRLEDVTCARKKQRFQESEMTALRNAHRAIRALEQLYRTESSGKRIA
jgi:hypothetical protein